MALVLSVPLTGFSLLLMLPGARSRLLGWAAPRCLRTLERLWDRHPWAVDTSIVLLTLGICLVLVLPPVTTGVLLLHALRAF